MRGGERGHYPPPENNTFRGSPSLIRELSLQLPEAHASGDIKTAVRVQLQGSSPSPGPAGQRRVSCTQSSEHGAKGRRGTDGTHRSFCLLLLLQDVSSCVFPLLFQFPYATKTQPHISVVLSLVGPVPSKQSVILLHS